MSSPSWDQWLQWNREAIAASERQYQDTLRESRADRDARLQVAANQLKAERERNAITRGQVEADRIYKEGQLQLLQQEAALNRDKFALSQELGRGELELGRGRLGLDTTLGLGNLGLGQAKLEAETGLGLLNLRSQLRGPESWAQYLDLGEGMTSLQPSSGFLTAISQGRRPPGMDAAFGGAPVPASLQGLAGSTADAQRARLANDMQLANQIAGNVGKIAPGTLESLSPDRLAYMSGLWETGGHSARTLLDAANKAGIGQGSAFHW